MNCNYKIEIKINSCL